MESTETSYSISESQENEIFTELEKVSDELSGFKRNSELKEAYISKIVPPGVDDPETSIQNDKIQFKYTLPSTDTFWESYDYPDARWPDENEFKQFTEEVELLSIDDIESLIGNRVDIEYYQGKWQTEFKVEQIQEPKNSSPNNTEEIDLWTVLGIVVTGFISLVILLVVLRQFIIIPLGIGSIILLVYLFNNLVQD